MKPKKESRLAKRYLNESTKTPTITKEDKDERGKTHHGTRHHAGRPQSCI
jgi:hypothetical protein